MKKILKTLAFVLVGVFAVTALVACGGKHEHKYTYESDNTKHKGTCECGDVTDYEPHEWGEWTVTKEATENEKGSRKHTCTVCGKEVAEDIKQLDPELAVSTAPMAVYAQVPADWESVNIYYWNSLSGDENTLESGYAVGWPGVPMTLVNAEKHLWGFEIPKGVENVIFNDGSAQTVDIKLAKAKNLYVLSEEANGENKFEITYDSYTKKDTDPELAKPVLKEAGYVVTYVTVLEGWENVNVYWYGSAKTVEWPGAAMTAVDGATNVYSFDKVPDDASHVIFNNGDGTQTVDIPVVKGLNGFILQEDVEDGKHLAKTGDYNLGTKVIDEVTLVDFYAQVPADWEEVNIYFWEGAAGLKPAAWPGAAMTLVDAEKHIYKYAIDSRVATIIINAGADTDVDLPQTPNTLINFEGVNAVIVTAADSKDGAEAALAKYADGAMTPAEVVIDKTITELYVVGSMNDWSKNDAYKLTIADNTATIELELAAEKEFKVFDGDWGHDWATFGYVDSLSEAFSDKGGNILVVTAGTYVITVSNLDTTPVLTITAKAA